MKSLEASTLDPMAADHTRSRRSLSKCLRFLFPFLTILAVWQIFALQAEESMGQLFPTIQVIGMRAWELLTGPLAKALSENSNLNLWERAYWLFQSPLLWHTLFTFWRLSIAFLIACMVGLGIGLLMSRFTFWEDFFVPIVSVLLPIPTLAWTPIAVLWLGLGAKTVIIITAFAALLPIIVAVRTGVKTVNPQWVRAAKSMNASRLAIFRTVIVPGSLPVFLSGLRIGLARAWRAAVAAEAFSGIRWGLSAGIFDAQEYLDTAFMMVAITVLGISGYAFEKFLFEPLERRTVIRWGMMEAPGAPYQVE